MKNRAAPQYNKLGRDATKEHQHKIPSKFIQQFGTRSLKSKKVDDDYNVEHRVIAKVTLTH